MTLIRRLFVYTLLLLLPLQAIAIPVAMLACQMDQSVHALIHGDANHQQPHGGGGPQDHNHDEPMPTTHSCCNLFSSGFVLSVDIPAVPAPRLFERPIGPAALSFIPPHPDRPPLRVLA